MSEVITLKKFDEKLIAGKLVLSLVGMSNVGKSYWSKKLAKEAGFTRRCNDDEIEAGLRGLLAAEGFEGGIKDVARWMGQPYESQSSRNQQKYLDLENRVLENTISQLEREQRTGNVVIDTTGSVVHANSAIVERLGAVSTVVYLAASPAMQSIMFKRYIEKPKPVVWGDLYSPEDGEHRDTTLARCYPNLLSHRSELYGAMAHIIIPREVTENLGSAEGFINHIRSNLITA